MRPRIRTFLTLVILVATVVLSSLALLIDQQFTTTQVKVGEPSPETFVTESPIEIEDVTGTEQARAQAAGDVVPVYGRDEGIDTLVIQNIQGFFESVGSATVDQNARPLPVVTTSTTIPPSTTAAPTTTVAPAPTTSTTAPEVTTAPGEVTVEEPPEPVASTVAPATTVPVTTLPAVIRTAGVSGRVFIDLDEDDNFLTGRDRGLGDVRLVAYDSTGTQFVARTFTDGRYSFTGMAIGPATVLVDTDTVPERLTAPVRLLLQRVDLVEDREIQLQALPMTPVVVGKDIQAANLRTGGYLLSDATVLLLVEIATGDVTREILGVEPWLRSIEREVVLLATEALNEDGGILSEELLDVKRAYRSRPRFVQLPDADPAVWQQVSTVVTEVATEFLAANKSVDEVATQLLREKAFEEVVPLKIEYAAGVTIVEEEDEVTAEIERALKEAGLLGAAAPRYVALAAAVLLVVGLLAVYIFRFQRSVWTSLRRIALFGLLITLAALAARGTAVFADTNGAIGYLVPAAAFGLMTAILFDARTSVLMAVAVGSMTAIATTDPGYTLFAILSTVAPVPFVSAISARRDLRRAAIYIVALSATFAAVIAWFFHEDIPVYEAAAFAVANGAVSWLIGSSLLSFLEIMFDITTSLRLLDLTDRNHPALRLLEDKAIGSFNHSLMVGTLADRAARAVDANPLLARAAAYYHDLGKTENPQFFIENQFGVQNPHNQMAPERSAEVIRRHVLDGLSLARKFRIPGEVAESVITHHGDGVMHFFYNKAQEHYGADAVDIEDYRHAGRKPVRKEMAIVMMADSVEGACRAVFQTEEPSPERIEQLVEQVVGEKVADGQLSISQMTLGDLTKAKAAMVDALVGHYHQRIPYPNFPNGG